MERIINRDLKSLQEMNQEASKEIVRNLWHLKLPLENLTIKAILPSSYPFQGVPEFLICMRGGTEWIDVKRHLLEQRPEEVSEQFLYEHLEGLLRWEPQRSIIEIFEGLSDLL